MKALFNQYSHILQITSLPKLKAIILLLCISLSSCSMATQAANVQEDAELEAKVLQIIQKHPEAIMKSVEAHVQKKEHQQEQAQKAFFKKMVVQPKSIIGKSPTDGSSESKIILLEFSDFQCPFCAKTHQTLKQFIATNQGKITRVYKFLPITDIHSEAMPSAKAAWAAGQQGKFWQFHDILFENQDKLSDSFYISTAKALNLDLKRFNKERNSRAASAAVETDMQLAKEIGVSGTPTLLMNGQILKGDVQITDLEKLLSQDNQQ
ncbi:DSBA oxidoreductase [Calothrix sp. NIES-4071]|nr:DSBA oxidoreductase [Calothrix sp. NIES-4071]BAZ54962.1 DSBA oxidoreductase [Calothrix sp. NIES-4105]